MQTTPDPSGYPDVRKVGLGSGRLYAAKVFNTLNYLRGEKIYPVFF